MSRIDDLIAELCPDGVARIALREVTTTVPKISWAKVGAKEFEYIDLSSVDVSSGRLIETSTVDYLTAPSRAQQVVAEGDVLFATTRPTQMRCAVVSREYDGQIASSGYCVLRPRPSTVLTGFLAHVLRSRAFSAFLSENQMPGNYPSIRDSALKAFEIPLPPIQVQEAITRTLDTFTELEAELEAELGAELEARTTQYEETRNRLLDLGGDLDAHPLVAMIRELSPNGVDHSPLAEVGTFERGNGMEKALLTSSGEPAIHYGEIHTRYGIWAEETFSFVSASQTKGLREANPGDLVIATTSEDIEGVGNAVVWLGPQRAYVSGEIHIFRHSQNPKYLGYFFRSEGFQRAKLSMLTGTKVKRISMASLGKIVAPIPPLPVQDEIVRILDSFDALVTDISIGLPAEIKARRKQYEYYRDKLLNFEGLAA